MKAKPIPILLVAGALAVTFGTTAHADVISAGTLVVDLRAPDFDGGATWVSRDPAARVFDKAGDSTGTNLPTSEIVAGVPAVTFYGNPLAEQFGASRFESLPATGSGVYGNSDWSAEAWVYNPELAVEEDYFQWGARYDPFGAPPESRTAALAHGTNELAYVHWADDGSFVGGPPTAGEWHHIVVTYGGGTDGLEKLYVDGVEQVDARASRTLDITESINLIVGSGYNRGAVRFEVPFTGSLNTIRLHDGVLSDADVLNNYNAGPASTETSAVALTVEAGGGDLIFRWDSQAGKVYDLLSSTDLTSPRGTWPVWDGHQDIEATPDQNELTIGRPVADAVRFFAIAERDAPPPPPLLDEDFEGAAAIPDQWADDDNGAGTAWEVGDPSAFTGSFGLSPTTGFGPSTNCAGTNITDDYTASATATLKTHPVVIPAGGATLTFQQWIDTEVSPSDDFGTIRVLDADDGDSELAVLETGIEGVSGIWMERDFSLAAYAGMNIRIEFAFESDADADVYAGWYIDDVVITAGP